MYIISFLEIGVVCSMSVVDHVVAGVSACPMLLPLLDIKIVHIKFS